MADRRPPPAAHPATTAAAAPATPANKTLIRVTRSPAIQTMVMATGYPGDQTKQALPLLRDGKARARCVPDRAVNLGDQQSLPDKLTRSPTWDRAGSGARPGVRFWEPDGSGDRPSGALRRGHRPRHTAADLRRCARPASLNTCEPGSGRRGRRFKSGHPDYVIAGQHAAR